VKRNQLNDTGNAIVVFDNKATGDPAPIRKLSANGFHCENWIAQA